MVVDKTKNMLQKKHLGLQGLKYLLSGPLPKKFAVLICIFYMPFQPIMFSNSTWVSRSASKVGCSPNFSARQQNLQCSGEKQSRRGMWPLPFTFMEPSELDAFLFTVVASALFCLCCRYWAFCFQICNQIRQNKINQEVKVKGKAVMEE